MTKRESIFAKLYPGSKQQAYADILQRYQQQWRAILSFLYFSSVMHGRLLEDQPEQWQRDYLAALHHSDYILPDGIALQLFYRCGAYGRATGQMPANLNGTDFIPWFLDQLLGDKQSCHISLLTCYDETIGKPASQIEQVKQAFVDRFGVPLDFVDQIPYKERLETEFDLQGYTRSLQASDDPYRILLISMWPPKQEIWSQLHKEFIRRQGLLVFNSGGMIDYISGFERRAPERVVKARVLEAIWRVIQNPHKNIKKILPMFGIVRYRLSCLRSK